MTSCVPSENENDLEMIETPAGFHQLPLPSWLVSQHDLAILAANNKAEHIYHYDQFEWKELSLNDIVMTDDSKQLLNFLHQPSDSGKIYLLHTKGDKVLPGKLYVTELLLKGQKIWQVIAVNTTSGNVSVTQDLAISLEYQNMCKQQSSEGTWCFELERPLPVDCSVAQMMAHFKEYAYLIECNTITANLLECENPSELLGLRLSSVLDFEKQETIDMYTAFQRNNFRISNAELVVEKNGNNKYIVCNFFAVFEEHKLIRVWGTHIDITEKRKTEKKVRLLACLLEESFDVLAATDLEWNHVTWNNGAEKIYGITAEQIIGKNIISFIPEIHYIDATHDEMRVSLHKNGFWRGNMSFIRPSDQKQITLLTHFKQLKDEKGALVGYVFSGTDITGKKESELQLKETENRFVEIADTAPVIIWMTDHEHRISYVNKTWQQFSGINRKQISDLNWKEFIHPEDIERVKQIYTVQITNRQPISAIYRVLHHSNKYHWMMDTAKPRILADGTFLGYIGSIVDINESKIKEDQLRHQATILNNISDVIITTDLQHHVLSLNNVAELVFGVTSDLVKGKYLYHELVFDFGKSKEEVFKEFIAEGVWKGEVSIIGKNGEKKYFLFTTSYFVDGNGNKIAIMGVGRDITDRKKADEKLLVSEQFYRNLIADSANGVFITDVDGTLRFASNAVSTILGYDPGEILGANCFQYIHIDDQQLAMDAFQRELKDEAIIKSIEIRLRKSNGEWLWCLVRGHNQLQNPYVQGVVIYFHDDTLRKRASDALKESERRFRTLIRDIQVGVVLLDADAKVLLSNKAINDIFFFGDEYIIGKSLYEFAEDITDEKGVQFTMTDCPLYKAVKNKTQVNDVVMGVYRPQNDDRVWIMMNADPIYDADGEVVQVICSIKDISERKKLEKKLLDEKITHQKQLTQATIEGQEKERREIGKELHDNFGQQLTTIKLFLDMAKSTADDATNEMISMGLKGISDVINGIRRMSRNLMPPTLGDLGLIDSIFDLIEGINRTQAINIEFDFFEFKESYISENKQLMAFRIVQEQLNNIIKHAQAGNVTIKLYNNEVETFLEITDDGKGFDIKTVKKGLGLANIRNRAEIFGGTATIDSAPGKGCHLKVYIPNRQQ